MTWWQYLILANLYLVLFYGFYVLLLRRETFFQLNRVYLVASAVLSFLIPAIQADWVQNLFITQQVSYNQPVIIYQYTAVEDNRISIGQILAMIYAAGIVLLTCRLVWQLFKLKKLVDQPQAPVSFSFFKKIKINRQLSNSDIITAHEEVHAKQWHSADVLIMEVIMILNWFNPVVYFYRRAIKHIHEFIADSQVIKTGADKAGYAMMLLTHTLNSPSHSLASQFFNHKLLKKRIIMLQKSRSQRIKLAKYGLSAPLFALMLILSSATVNNSRAVETINNTAEKVLEAPAKATVVSTIASANKAIGSVIDNTVKTAEKLNPLTDTIPDNPTEIFSIAEQAPQFKGGDKAFIKFMGDNIRYPKTNRDKKISGTVHVSFIIQKDGTLSDAKVTKSVSSTIDAEALRVMRLSPKWKPGYQNGRPVRVRLNIIIPFNLENSKEDKNELFTRVENNPEFIGGIQAFNKFLSQNIRYPKDDREKNIEGRVFLRFVIERNGSLSDIRVLRGVSKTIDAEAVRVIKASPKWKPGYQNGRPVRVQYNVPISFWLGEKTGAVTKPDTANKDAYKAHAIRVSSAGGLIREKPRNSPTYSIGVAQPTFIFNQAIPRSPGDKYGIVLDVQGKAPAKIATQLILLNGDEISRQSMEALDVKKIKSMNALTGDDATNKYGDRGKLGAIEITTKPVIANGKVVSDFFIQSNNLIDPATRPLIIKDGREISYEKLAKINAKDIESVSVLKDNNVTSTYGLKAKNGVLLITSK